MTPEDDKPEESRPMTPEARARPGCSGVPIALGETGTWLLARAPYARVFDAHRDRIHQDIEYQGSVVLRDTFECAWSLLSRNYDLSGEEAAYLLGLAEQKALTDATFDAIFLPDDPVRGASEWIRSSLLANGLDPAKVPPADLSHVLYQLEHTGRIMPLAEFASVSRAMRARRGLTS